MDPQTQEQQPQTQQVSQTQNGNGDAQVPATTTQQPARAPVAVGSRGVEIKSFDDMLRFSNMVAQSDLAPKDYRGKAANVAVAIQFGMELGIAPMQAMQNIAVVNGRPSIWGDLALALVEGSGLLVDKDEHFEGEWGKDDFRAVCVTQRRGRKPYTVEFSIADAKTAGLWGKQGPWQTNPKRMLQMRARGFNLRDNFPDVLKGMMFAEEVIDIPVETEPTSDPVKTNDLMARLDAAREGKPVTESPAVEVVDTKPPAAEPKPAPKNDDALGDAVAAVNAVIRQLDEKSGRAGCGVAILKRIAKQDHLQNLTVEQLDTLRTALEAELEAVVPEKPETKGTGQRELI